MAENSEQYIPPTYLPSYVEQSFRVLQGERFIPMILLGPNKCQRNVIGTPTLRILKNVVDKIGNDRRQRQAARLTDMLRMSIYRLVSPWDTIEKIAILSKRERQLLSESRIARGRKDLKVDFSDEYWILPKPRLIPKYILSVMQSITLRIKLKTTIHSKKYQISSKFAELLLSLPKEYDNKRVSFEIDEPSA